jgi:hypothetical protein
MHDVANWKRMDTDSFWGEIAPSDHVVQIYEDDQVLLDTLAGFACGGITAGDCVIVVATNPHLEALSGRLRNLGVDADSVIADDQFIPIEAEALLSAFLTNGWPNEELFMSTITELVKRATLRHRKVRAFGEMVAVLWAQRRFGAAVNLEYLWNKFCARHKLSLFCAYPKSGFKTDIGQSITGICKCHSKIIHGINSSFSEVLYRNVT